ncbi:MAG: 50S ribosomal protein L1, partial [Planctomycetota bacterium]
MPKQSKRYRSAAAKQKPEPMPLSEAVATLKTFDKTKFDQSVEIAMRLGVDPA